MNILLLSAGGPSCHGVIKSLRDIKFQGKIISVDSNEMSAGFYLSDVHYVVPKAFDEDYISALLNIVKKEHIDLILPTSSNEIITISKHSHFFDSLWELDDRGSVFFDFCYLKCQKPSQAEGF